MDKSAGKGDNTGPRRSSRLSGGGRYGKRKRVESSAEEEEEVGAGAKMTKTAAAAADGPSTVDFTFDDLKRYMNGEFLTTINQNMEKNHKKLSDRIDKTQEDLNTHKAHVCLLYTSPSPRDGLLSRMPSSA